ncbi:hypothetical protein HPB52_001688 [Rhipicephalus sanguineus]|uniref:Uncharacterized protein n=1 Tax=Rhipicephalus sanguineus TaxID=34632 RepID=A0A9D4SQH8_RHISA|nr:hypothetical protein HPB52_001688 [Rhipicephalus sanguineus]
MKRFSCVFSEASDWINGALLQVEELSLGQRTYPVSAYLSAPDNSCKCIVPGLEPGTTSHTLVEEMQATGIQILQARMMGQTNIALITFERLREQSYAATPTAPDRRSAKRAPNWDTEPTTALHRTSLFVSTAAIDNPMPSHPCSPRCKSCGGDHATTDPSARDASDSPSTDPGHGPDPGPRHGQNQSCSRSRSQSTSARIPEKRPATPASHASPSPHKKTLLGIMATARATSEYQQPRASDNSNAMTAPREVSFEQGHAQLISPHPPPHNTSRPSPPSNTNTDPFPEIVRLSRAMEARHAQMMRSWTLQ